MHKRSRARVHDPRVVPLPMLAGEDTRFTPSQPLSRPANARQGYPVGSTRPFQRSTRTRFASRAFGRFPHGKRDVDPRSKVSANCRSGCNNVPRCVDADRGIFWPLRKPTCAARRLQVASGTRYSLTARDFVFSPRRKRKHFTGSEGRSFAIKRVLSAETSRRDMPGEETANNSHLSSAIVNSTYDVYIYIYIYIYMYYSYTSVHLFFTSLAALTM